MSGNCRRCGHPVGEGSPTPNSCGHCPAVRCEDCGEPDDRTCSCWVPLEGLGMPELKHLFAIADLSVSKEDES